MASMTTINAVEPATLASVSDARNRKRRAILVSASLVLLIVAGIIRSAIATRFDSFTIDEPFHITAGVSYVRTGDFRLNPEHPPLVKLWVGAFLTRAGFQLPPFRALQDKPDERDFTEETTFLANDADRLQSRVRAVMLLLHGLLMLGLALSVWRALGHRIALATTALLMIDPTVAAHLPVVMTDLPVALLSTTAMLLAVVAFRSWRLRDAALTALALGLALGSKHSAIITFAAVAVFGLAMVVRKSGERVVPRVRRIGAVAVVLLGAWLMLWAQYGLRFDESAAGRDLFNRPLAAKIDDVKSPLLRGAMRGAETARLLPRAYLWGLADVVRAGVEGRAYPLYAFGKSYIARTPVYFFPGLLLVKLPLGLLALMVLGAGLAFTRRLPPNWRLPLTGLALLAVLFLASLTFSNSGYAGVRHALPVIPPLIVLAAVAVVIAWDRRSRQLGAIVVLAIFAAAISALPIVRPWEYYNELVGGAENGARYFSDEGTDLGQRTIEVTRYYEEHLRPSGEVPFIHYELSRPETKYRSIPRRDWNSEDEAGNTDEEVTGTFFISAAYVTPSPFYDLQAFRDAQPVARFGNLLIFQGTFHLPWRRAAKLYDRAMEVLYAEEPDEASAERLLAEAVTLYPQAYPAAIELGNLLAKRGARQEAVRAYETARAHAPADDEIVGLLTRQIEHIAEESPEMVPPLRNPWVE